MCKQHKKVLCVIQAAGEMHVLRQDLRICPATLQQYKSATQQAMRNALQPGTKKSYIFLCGNILLMASCAECTWSFSYMRLIWVRTVSSVMFNSPAIIL